MKKVSIEVPGLYGDHHVVEVRRILLEMPGVRDVYASSAFHLVEVTFDTEKVSEEAISHKLEEVGYLREMAMPTESGVAAYLDKDQAPAYFRHTAVYETTRRVVSFSQNVSYSGKPLWNCPGFGVIKNKMMEE